MGLLNDWAARPDDRRADPRLTWRRQARPEQKLPPGRWRIWFIRGGRGSGKTRSGSGGLAEWVLSDTDGEGEYGIIAPTYADAWTKCVEGEAGILRALGTSMAEIKDHRSAVVKAAWRTYGQVILHNGIVIYADSAAEGGLRIQGRNLKGAWADEVGLWDKWDTAWKESLNYAVRKGRAQIIATGTPKAARLARKLVRSLIQDAPEHGGVVNTRLRTIDNIANLAETFLRSVIGAAQGTRLERQELEGELLDDVANALWTREQLDAVTCPAVGEPGGPGFLLKTVIGVDPSDGNEASDEQAYTIMGEGPPDDPHLYVAENWGGQEAPAAFAYRVILKAVQWDATIIVEKNHGGEWLVTVFDQVMREMIERGLVPRDKRPRVEKIHASQAKRSRAEPVSALYTRLGGTLVRHCHKVTVKPCDCQDQAHPDGHRVPDEHMPELEDQMATFTGAQGERSPDRLDSLVWAGSTFLRYLTSAPVAAVRARWATGDDLRELTGGDDLDIDVRTGAGREDEKRRKLPAGHGYAQRHGWQLDDFAPHEPDETEHGARGNVYGWQGSQPW